MATCPRCGASIKRSKKAAKYWCNRHGFVRREDELRVKLSHAPLGELMPVPRSGIFGKCT